MSQKTPAQVAQSVVGKTEAQAVAAIKSAGYCSRVVSIDGVAQIVTCDMNLNRIGLSLSNGVVAAARVG